MTWLDTTWDISMPPTSYLPRPPSRLSEFRAFIVRSVVKSTVRTDPYSRGGLVSNVITHAGSFDTDQ
jgi:hypothetical protein